MNHSRLPFIDLLLNLIIITLCFTLSSTGRLGFFTTLTNTIFSPLRLPLTTLSQTLTSVGTSLRDLPQQQRLINDLRRQNQELSLLANQATQLKTENDSLKSALNSPISPLRPLLPVKITALSRYAIIDKGSKQGLTPGLALVSGGTLLGLTHLVSTHTSSILLLSDPSFSLPATTLTQATGKVSVNGGTLTLTGVTSNSPLKQTDPVFTSAYNQIPSGLLIAKIKSINSPSSAVQQSAILTPADLPLLQQSAFIVLP